MPLAFPLKCGPLWLLSLLSLEPTAPLSEPGAASQAPSTSVIMFPPTTADLLAYILAPDVSQLINEQIYSEASKGGDWRAEVSGGCLIQDFLEKNMPLTFSPDPLISQIVKILGQRPMRGIIWCSLQTTISGAEKLLKSI